MLYLQASISLPRKLLESILINPFVWFLLRVLTGISMVCIYTVAESWVNDLSDNEHRGQALSVYMIVSMAGSAFGQLFLNIADPETATLFMIVSILISISLVPILIVVSKQPDFSVAKFFTVKELYKASPLGVVTAIMTGLAHGTLWGIGSIYGLKNGLSIEQISIFMFTFVIVFKAFEVFKVFTDFTVVTVFEVFNVFKMFKFSKCSKFSQLSKFCKFPKLSKF